MESTEWKIENSDIEVHREETKGVTEGRDGGSDRGKRQLKKCRERDKEEEKKERDRGEEIRCERHLA
jgi:hypothetical protein